MGPAGRLAPLSGGSAFRQLAPPCRRIRLTHTYMHGHWVYREFVLTEAV
jgi:hypothetical protein